LVHFGQWLFKNLWGRGFKNVRIFIENVEALETCQTKGTLIFSPNHESYLDSVYIHRLALDHQLIPFASAAGQNVNFFPIGWLLRKGGAYFVLRKGGREPFAFKCLKVYQHWLVHNQIHQQVFHEGGRTRTGRIRKLKLGYFEMFQNLALNHNCSSIFFLPIRFRYDLLPDPERIALQEAAGEKKPENFLWLLDTVRHSFRTFGDVEIYIGNPVQLQPDLTPEDQAKKVYKKVGSLGRVMESEWVAWYLLWKKANQQNPKKVEMNSFVRELNEFTQKNVSLIPEKIDHAWNYFQRRKENYQIYLLDYYLQHALSYYLPTACSAFETKNGADRYSLLSPLLNHLFHASPRNLSTLKVAKDHPLIALLAFPLEEIEKIMMSLKEKRKSQAFTTEETIRDIERYLDEL